MTGENLLEIKWMMLKKHVIANTIDVNMPNQIPGIQASRVSLSMLPDERHRTRF
jgi:hypothetical protein